ncbi:hypothetical protein EMMF5_003276 [Cystobasidiomycetes sp. EMM_F5]
MADTASVKSEQPLDGQLFASLLPSLVKLYELAASEDTKQLDIARLAATLKTSLEQAKEQARSMAGGDLTLSEQKELIAILEGEVEKRKPKEQRAQK